MTNQYIVDRHLPERAKLVFYFPNPSEGKEHLRVIMPFFENPTIKETKKARFKKYSLVSRSSDLYAYTGANSRQLQLSFNLTIPHILEEHPEIISEDYIYKGSMSDDPKTEKERFKSPVSAPPNTNSIALGYAQKFFKDNEGLQSSAKQVLLSTWGQRGITDKEADYIKTMYDLTDEDIEQAQEALNSKNNAVNQVLGFPMYEKLNFVDTKLWKKDVRKFDEQFENRMKVLDIILFWVNMIRASVVNNAQNSIYGPPVVRLRHGIMYQDVPCLCHSYSIGWDEKAGYDLQTLFPRQIQITMKLEEFRTGDFGVFDQNDIIGKDNLAGWESVINEPNSMDPGYNTL